MVLKQDTTEQSSDSCKMEGMMKSMTEIDESVTQLVTGLINNFQKDVTNGKLNTTDGISLLDVKNQVMLSYLIDVVYVVSKKCQGESIEDDLAIDRLVENRTVLERIRPLEHKLKYMMDKLTKAALTGVSNENDPTHFRANPENMVDNANASDSESEEDEETVPGKKTDKKQGLYVPPRLAPMHYDEEENIETRRKQQLERAKRRALHSSVIGELREQYLDTPAEVSHSNMLRATTSRKQQLKTRYEEEYMTRLPTSKKERHRGRHSMAVGNIGDQLTYFEDIQVLENDDALTGSGKRKRNSSSKSTKKKGFKRRKTR